MLPSHAQSDDAFSEPSGTDALKLCLDITGYWTGSIFDHAEGILDFYGQSIELIGKDAKYYRTETLHKARPVTAESLDLVPFWLSRANAKRHMHILWLESGPAPDVPSDRAFAMVSVSFDQPAGAIRLILPVSFIDQSVETYVELAKSLVRKFEFASGHGGLALNWSEVGNSEAESRMYYLGRRFPGIDLPNLTSTLHAIPHGIKCINWLTLLNADDVQRLGGLEELQRVLGDDIPVYPLAHGALIQAGPKPDMGDVNRRRKLFYYHRVGHVLAPLRAEDHPAFIMHGDEIFEQETTEEWLARFD